MGFSDLEQLLQEILRLVFSLDGSIDPIKWTLINNWPPIRWRTGSRCCDRGRFSVKFEVLVLQNGMLFSYWNFNEAILAFFLLEFKSLMEDKSLIHVLHFGLDKCPWALLTWSSLFVVQFKISWGNYFDCGLLQQWDWIGCVILVDCILMRKVTITLTVKAVLC